MIQSLFALPLLLAGSGAYIVRMESSPDPNHQMRLAYPLTALQVDAEGDAKFEVQVGKDGYPAGCKIVTSSGHPALDTETCNLMMLRGKWRPATTPQGEPREFVFTDTMQWRLDRSTASALPTQYQQDDYPPAALALGIEGVSKVELAIDEAGDPKSCAIIQSAGHADLDQSACNILMKMSGFKPRGDVGDTVRPLVSVQSVRWKIPKSTPDGEPKPGKN